MSSPSNDNSNDDDDHIQQDEEGEMSSRSRRGDATTKSMMMTMARPPIEDVSLKKEGPLSLEAAPTPVLHRAAAAAATDQPVCKSLPPQPPTPDVQQLQYNNDKQTASPGAAAATVVVVGDLLSRKTHETDSKVTAVSETALSQNESVPKQDTPASFEENVDDSHAKPAPEGDSEQAACETAAWRNGTMEPEVFEADAKYPEIDDELKELARTLNLSEKINWHRKHTPWSWLEKNLLVSKTLRNKIVQGRWKKKTSPTLTWFMPSSLIKNFKAYKAEIKAEADARESAEKEANSFLEIPNAPPLPDVLKELARLVVASERQSIDGETDWTYVRANAGASLGLFLARRIGKRSHFSINHVIPTHLKENFQASKAALENGTRQEDTQPLSQEYTSGRRASMETTGSPVSLSSPAEADRTHSKTETGGELPSSDSGSILDDTETKPLSRKPCRDESQTEYLEATVNSVEQPSRSSGASEDGRGPFSCAPASLGVSVQANSEITTGRKRLPVDSVESPMPLSKKHRQVASESGAEKAVKFSVSNSANASAVIQGVACPPVQDSRVDFNGLPRKIKNFRQQWERFAQWEHFQEQYARRQEENWREFRQCQAQRIADFRESKRRLLTSVLEECDTYLEDAQVRTFAEQWGTSIDGEEEAGVCVPVASDPRNTGIDGSDPVAEAPAVKVSVMVNPGDEVAADNQESVKFSVSNSANTSPVTQSVACPPVQDSRQELLGHLRSNIDNSGRELEQMLNLPSRRQQQWEQEQFARQEEGWREFLQRQAQAYADFLQFSQRMFEG